MDEYRSPEMLEKLSQEAQPQKQDYTPRPKSQIVLAWVLAVVVVLAFLGTCYWLMYGRF